MYLETPEVILGAAREGDSGRELCLLGFDGHPWLFLEKNGISLETSTEVERKAGVQCKALRQLGGRDGGERHFTSFWKMLVLSYALAEKHTRDVSQLLLGSVASDRLVALVCSNTIHEIESLANVGLAIAHVVSDENKRLVI
jgi:hypothetical protein